MREKSNEYAKCALSPSSVHDSQKCYLEVICFYDTVNSLRRKIIRMTTLDRIYECDAKYIAIRL